MKIELIIEKNCISLDILLEIKKQLAKEFSSCYFTTTVYDGSQFRLQKLGISILPAWLVDEQLLPGNPYDYNLLRNTIHGRLNGNTEKKKSKFRN